MQEIAHVAPQPRQRGRIVPMNGARTIKEFILARPTFFEHADGLKVDWRYLHERDANAIAAEAGWIKRQGLRLIIDLTSGVNLYPDLRLINNVPDDYTASRAAISGVIAKMSTLGAEDLLLSLHRVPETNSTAEETRAGFVVSVREICAQAHEKGIIVHLRMTPNGAHDLTYALAMIKDVNAPNLRLAAPVAMLHKQGVKPEEVADSLADHVGLWLAAAPKLDIASRVWTYQGSLSGRQDIDVKSWLAIAPEAPVALDGVYPTWDEAYLDLKTITDGLNR